MQIFNIKEIDLKQYLLLGAAFLYIFFMFFVLLYILKFSLSLYNSVLYCLVPLLEISFFYIFFSLIFSFKFFHKHLYILKYAYVFLCIIYVIQGFSFYISGNLLSLLAIENWREYRYFAPKFIYIILVLVPVIFSAYYFSLFSKIKHSKSNTNKIEYLCILSVMAGIFLLHVIHNHSAVLSLVSNVSEIVSEKFLIKLPFIKKEENSQFKIFFNIDETKQYPFLKEDVYINNRYMITHEQKPNVIVLFLEGCSARFMGAYNGEFDNLTPNIDDFSKIQGICRVDNYFNHTAATYRGIIGTMTSSYPLHGGFENGTGWENRNNSLIYKKTIVSSVPKILQSFQYKTVMFTPFKRKAPFNDMCKMLYFEDIYSSERSIKELLGTKKYVHQDILSDEGIFLALTAYLSKNEYKKQPHFISLYNRGSHAFGDVIEEGKKYQNGQNQVLNRIHNMDCQLAYFLNYFKKSRWASNTYLIITTDHATFPEPAYIEIVKQNDYFFVDKIPLLIYDPYKGLPAVINANSRNSVDLAPTILNLIGIKKIQNAFLGYSLLDNYPYSVSISAVGKVIKDRYITVKGKIYPLEQVPSIYKDESQFFSQYIDLYRSYEQKNMIFPPDGR